MRNKVSGAINTRLCNMKMTLTLRSLDARLMYPLGFGDPTIDLTPGVQVVDTLRAASASAKAQPVLKVESRG